MALILASGSPRRKDLLTQVGLSFQVVAPEVDETVPGTAGERVVNLAQRKAEAVSALYPDDTVIAADTLVALGDRVLGKPVDPEDARRMLEALSGQTHQVYTGVCVKGPRAGTQTQQVCTNVRFVRLDSEAIDRYVAGGEPMDKAGSYGMQGMATMFVESIDGSPSNVIGLPMHTLRAMLMNEGFVV